MPSMDRNKIPLPRAEDNEPNSFDNGMSNVRIASNGSTAQARTWRGNKIPTPSSEGPDRVSHGIGQDLGREAEHRDSPSRFLMEVPNSGNGLGPDAHLFMANGPLKTTLGTWLLEALCNERLFLEQTLERRHRLLAQELESKLALLQMDRACICSAGTEESDRAGHVPDSPPSLGRHSRLALQRPKEPGLPWSPSMEFATDSVRSEGPCSEASPRKCSSLEGGAPTRGDPLQSSLGRLRSRPPPGRSRPYASSEAEESRHEEGDRESASLDLQATDRPRHHSKLSDHVATPTTTESRRRKTKIKHSTGTDSIDLRFQSTFGRARRKLRRLVNSVRFELFFVVLIFANAVCMAVESQYMGIVTGQEARLEGSFGSGPTQDWPGAASAFEAFDVLFGALFTIELVLKMIAYLWKFPHQFWNVFDLIVVVTWYVDKFGGSFLLSPLLMRILRLSKAMRLIRLARMFSAFDSLSLMFCSLKASTPVAAWSLLLLMTLTTAVAMMMNVLTKSYILDLSNDEDRRLEVYMYFGTFSRSMISMTEVTLGNWVPIIRMIQEFISGWLAFGLLAYQLCVGFAVVRVITGVFLHETFKVAGNDDEMMILQKHRESEHFQEKIGTLFQEADENGDDLLSEAEFDSVLEDARMREWLGSMGFEPADARMVWGLMDQSKQGITVTELGHCIQRLKGAAKSIDIVYVETRMDEICKELSRMQKLLPKQ